MNIAFFSTKPWVRRAFEPLLSDGEIQASWFEPRLTIEAATLAAGHSVACVFVNDLLDATVLRKLASCGVKLVALR